MIKRAGIRRIAALIAIHAFIIGLSISCGGEDSIGHGEYYLAVPNLEFGDVDMKSVEFFLDEPVERGTMTAWISSSGCPAEVWLCFEEYCELVYISNPVFAEEMFVVYSEESWVFDEYLYSFVPCYKDQEFAQEPFSCQKWTCNDAKHDIEVYLESPCQAEMLFSMDVEYFDSRTPFIGPLMACEAGMDCYCEDCYEDQWEDDCYGGDCY